MNVSMKKSIISRVALLLAGVVAFSGCKNDGAEASAMAAHQQQIPEVEVVSISLQALPWTQTYPSRVEGARQVEVRPRVSGIIVKRSYVEGSLVAEGDALFQIDPVPYKLAVQKAAAELAHASALEKQAERDMKRVTKLYESNAVSEKQRDDAISTYDLAKASRLSSDVALKQAELDLSYTSVTSPISGVTSKEVFNEGSLVSSADILTTVIQLDPVFVLFSLPEGDPAFQQLFANGSRHKEGSTALTLFTRNSLEYGSLGQVNFQETGVNPQTGSVRMRAKFANAEGVLLPGQFARVAFKDLKLNPSAVIPEAAILMTANGAIVYTVDENNTVQPRPVVLGPVLDQGQLITSGLNDGDRVIITSLIRLKPGMPVKAKVHGEDAAAASASAATGN